MKNKGRYWSIIPVLVVVISAAILLGNHGKKNDMGSMPGGSGSQSSSTSSKPDTSKAVEATAVEIANYSFSPAAIKVKVGQMVTWTNKDAVQHTVTADNKSADAPDGPLLAKDQTYSFTFKKAGSYTYHCTPHPYMKGTVVVTE